MPELRRSFVQDSRAYKVRGSTHNAALVAGTPRLLTSTKAIAIRPGGRNDGLLEKNAQARPECQG